MQASESSLTSMKVVLVFNEDQAMNIVAGSVTLLKSILQMFVVDSKLQFEQLVNSINANDIESAFRAVHTIKGMCLNIGADKTALIAKTLERKTRNADLDNILSDIEDLKLCLDELEAELMNRGYI